MFGVWSTVSRECKKVCMGKSCMHGRANPQGMKCQRVGPNEILCRHLVTRLCFCARRNGYTSYDYILAHSVDGYSLCVSDVKSLWKLVLMQDTKIWNWRSRSHVTMQVYIHWWKLEERKQLGIWYCCRFIRFHNDESSEKND